MYRTPDPEARTGFTNVVRRTVVLTAGNAAESTEILTEHQSKNERPTQKCAVIGCGFHGTSSAVSLIESELFSTVVLIDPNVKKAEGEAAELNRLLPFHSPMDLYAGDYDDLVNASLIVLTSDVGHCAEEDSCIEERIRALRPILRQIARYGTDAVLLVAGGPVDLLTAVALRLSGFPHHRVIGTGTLLETAHLKQLLARTLGVNAESVNALVLGEHGDGAFPAWSAARIAGLDLDCYCECSSRNLDPLRLHALFERIPSAPAGRTAAFSATSAAVRRIAEAIARDERAVLPLSTLLTGEYGIRGVALSLPAVIGKGGLQCTLSLPLSRSETERLRRSAERLREILDAILS